MKKRFLLGMIFVLSFSLVFAASCSDDQTVMRLYSEGNSHVSAWDVNVGAYPVEICYDDIFGFAYEGENPHTCTGENRVLSLHDSSNSHASVNSDADYDYDVCYGDLACAYDSSAGSECSNGGVVVARMYSNTNSHVALPSYSAYPVKVCCVSRNNIYWADVEGNKITRADFGDTVQLISKYTSSGDFSIKEADILLDDDIRDVEGIQVGGDRIGFWTIEDEDLDKTQNDYDGFYFEINGVESEYLEISPIGNDFATQVNIVSPACGSYFDEGETIGVEISATDKDDGIEGYVIIDGENITFGNGGISFEKTLDAAGDFQIVAMAVNSRGGRSKDISNIMVLDKEGATYVDGEYVAACISEPKNFEHILESKVSFDASSTRGVRVEEGVVDELIPGEYPFSWYWIFYPEEIEKNHVNTTNVNAYDFTAEFPIAGDNSASLRVEV